jgi:ABC-type uncharacterized transport system involved in gliding motility auxiliary subunit
VLLTTTPEAWLQTGNFVIDPNAPGYAFSREESATKGLRFLAVTLAGKMPSWFAGVPKPVREGSGEELPDLPAEAGESRIVVIGDVDMVSPYVQYTRSQQNPNFFIQVLDWLCNDDDIIGIRNRESQTGRLNKISDLQKRSAAMNFSKTLNVVLIPLGVIAAGLLIALRRRRLSAADLSAHEGKNTSGKKKQG